MGDYFHPQRRKLGFVALALACVFTCGWLRSARDRDVIVIRTGNETCDLLLSDSLWIGWIRFQDPDGFFYQNGKRSPEFLSHYEHGKSDIGRQGLRGPYRWYTQRCHTPSGKPKGPLDTPHLIIPYWLLVIPLTVLSACLLLSDPRVATSSGKQSQNI